MSVQRRHLLGAAVAPLLPAWRPAGAAALMSGRAREVYAGQNIVIGQSAVRSGPSAILGDEMALGLQAGFAAINAAGGISGRQLVLKSRDDGYEPDRCKRNTVELIEEGVFALSGFVGTPTCMAALPVVLETGVPFVGAFTGAAALREHKASVFHVRAGYQQEARTIVNQLLSYGTNAKIAIFRQADSYGEAVERAVKVALAERGLMPVVIASVQRNSLDVSAAARAIEASGATGVAMASVYGACAALIKALGAAGKAMMFCSVSFIGTSGLIRNLGAEARGIGISQVMPYPFDGGTAFLAGYHRAMKAMGPDAAPSYGSIEGYACAMTVAEGIRRCGDTLTRERFVRALEHPVDLGGFRLAFSEADHAPSAYTDLTVVDGQGRLRK